MFRLARFLTTLLFLILALPVYAQENDFGLSPADAETFLGGIQAMQAASSFQFNFTANLDLASDAEQVQLGLEGSGTVLPGENPEFDITLNGTSENISDIPSQFTVELRLIGGTLYARGTDHTTGQATPWEAQPAAELVNSLSASLDPTTSTQLQDAAGVLEAAGQIDLAEFIRVSRPAQEARFVAEFQFRDFFLSPGFASVLGEVLAASDTSTTYTPAQVNAVAAVMTTIFQNPNLSTEFTFGDDQRLQRVAVNMNLNMDASALVEDTPPITAAFQADFQLSGYDQTYTIAVPDDAVAPPTPAAVLQPIPGKALLPDQPIRIQMTGQGGLDLVYYAAEPGTISIYARSLDSNSVPVDTVLDVFAPSGDTLASNDDLNASSSDAGIENLDISTPGAYRIHLGTFASDETGGVEVVLTTGSALPPPEQGSDIAGRIENGQPFEYTFQGQAGQTVTITAQATNPPSPNLDLALTVYGPDGLQIGFDDDSGAQAGLGNRDAALVNFSLPADGEYRVEVSSYLNINGEFQLRIDMGG